MPAADIGKLIRKRRQALGMRQHELAARLGVDRSAVSAWERGRHFPLRYLGAIEEVLGIGLDDDGTQGLPPVVAENLDVPGVLAIWGIPESETPEPQRLALIRALLEMRREPPSATARRRRGA